MDSRCHSNSMTVASSPRNNHHWWGNYAIACQAMSKCIMLFWVFFNTMKQLLTRSLTESLTCICFLKRCTLGLNSKEKSVRKWNKSSILSFWYGINRFRCRLPTVNSDRNRGKGNDISLTDSSMHYLASTPFHFWNNSNQFAKMFFHHLKCLLSCQLHLLKMTISESTKMEDVNSLGIAY